jgi:hypothetical protein
MACAVAQGERAVRSRDRNPRTRPVSRDQLAPTPLDRSIYVRSPTVGRGQKRNLIPASAPSRILPASCPIEGRVKLERLTWGRDGEPGRGCVSFSVRTRAARTSSSSQIRGRGPRLCALSNETHGRPPAAALSIPERSRPTIPNAIARRWTRQGGIGRSLTMCIAPSARQHTDAGAERSPDL